MILFESKFYFTWVIYLQCILKEIYFNVSLKLNAIWAIFEDDKVSFETVETHLELVLPEDSSNCRLKSDKLIWNWIDSVPSIPTCPGVKFLGRGPLTFQKKFKKIMFDTNSTFYPKGADNTPLLIFRLLRVYP